jgi:hypothetical protein
MSNQLSSKIALAYTGTNATRPPNMFIMSRAPTPTDYQNFQLGDYWLYRVSLTANNGKLYVLLGLVANVANWALITGSSGIVEFLQGNTGLPVPPNASQVINVKGDGVGITIAGNPGTNTLTASLVGGGIATQSYATDPATGTAMPDASGKLTLAATDGLTISAAAHTVTYGVSGGGSIVTGLLTQDGHTVTPTAGVIQLSGGSNLTTTGTIGPNTATISLSGITQHSLQVGGAANALTQLGVATNGQLPIGSTGADPVLATLTAGSGVSITNAAGSITISSSVPSYTTGPFTPGLSFGGATTGITYSVQYGQYTQIGNVVFFSGGFILTNKGSAMGDALFTGLPHAIYSSDSTQTATGSSAYVTFSGGYTWLWGALIPSDTTIAINQGGSGVDVSTLTDAAFANNSAVNFTGLYFTSAT